MKIKNGALNKILLMGNPNVGKSALFSRLTGAKVVISNYPGTTVGFAQGRMKIGRARPVVIDVPGTYTLESTNTAEKVALEMLKDSDLVINVIDATNLERNLYLSLQLLERDIPVVIALNMWDETKHRGIDINVKKLEDQLKIPIVPTCALTGEGIRRLVNRFHEARAVKSQQSSDGEKWKKIGKIVEAIQKIRHHHHTFLENLGDLSIKPLTGLPIAAAVIFCAFLVIRFIGENLINYVFEPLFDKAWIPVLLKLSAFLGEGSFLHSIFIGNLINGEIVFKESFGLLTTGLFVPIAMVLPYILSFYLVLGLLEDFGYLPRFAVLLDNFMHHLGLHGYATIPLIMGLGCNVPGALAIRLLEERREKFITATMMAVAVPCMAQIAMIIGLVGERGGRYVALIFAILFTILIVKGLIMNKLLKGTSPEIFIEIPPYRIPHISSVLKKLWMRVVWFLKEAVPFVLLGVLFVNILYALKVIDYISRIFAPIMTGLWGLPKEAIG
ncbi:MAG: ferrous iron transporter B, partial [Candidatus Omnitrophica bacterium]|nr:ferrous iron transporter B [Candidatus Omnitrophota bacterium]